jgi:DNA processing protein
MLFWTGDLRVFTDGPAVAVIGSRRGSPCGLRTAHRLSFELAARGVRIVSGLARGIDGRAHRGALDGGGLTMAVLGSGLDVVYPPEHAALADEIRRRGVLMSEFPPGTSPDPFNFPLRNRLISGFSDAVVVVEAGDRSGTMITVEAALAQGRDVLAVPGYILRPGTRGSNRLLREGAGVVTCCDDVLEALGLEPSPEPGARRQERDGAAGRVTMALCSRPMHFDELVRALGVPPGALHALLLELEMKGIVEQRPGKLFGLPGDM